MNSVLNRVLPAVYLVLGILLGGIIIISIVYSVIGAELMDDTIKEYHPPKLLKNCPQLPISSSEQSNDVIAKFDVDNVPVNQILESYRKQGFKTDDLAAEKYGYGPHGVSFTVSDTNHVRTLVIKQWPDK